MKTIEFTLPENVALGIANTKAIMEATRRFEFIKELPEQNLLVFWDNHYEVEYCIRNDNTLFQLMQWLVDFYGQAYTRIGEEKAKRQIRSALGID